MKKTKFYLCLGVAMMMALTSCTMQKRVYTSGYHIEWLNGNNATVKQNNSQADEQKNISKSTIATVSTINEEKIPNNKTENTEINNGNNNPVAIINEILWLLLQMILMFILHNKLIIGIVHQFKKIQILKMIPRLL